MAFRASRAALRGVVVVLHTIGFATMAAAADQGSSGGGQSQSGDTSPSYTLVDEAAKTNIFTFDYGVPTSPALQLVSTSPSKFTTSTPLKPYVISVPTSWGGSQGQDSFAADFAPAWLLRPDETYTEYKNDSLPAFLTRLRIGGALDLGSDGGGDKSKQSASKLGFGLSTSLLNDNDPALTPDPKTAGKTYWDSCLDALAPVAEKYISALNTKYQTARNEIAQLVGNASTAKTALGANAPLPKSDIAADTLLRHLEKCVTDANCEALDAEGKLKALNDQIKTASAITSAQLGNVQDAIKTMSDAFDSGNAALGADYSKDVQICIADTNTLASHAPALDVGGGVEWQGTPGHASGFSQAAEVLWLGGRYPLFSLFTPGGGKHAIDSSGKTDMGELDYFMIGGSVRASWDEMSSTGDKTTPQIRANTLNAWAGIERVTSGSQFTAQIGYEDVNAVDSAQSAFTKSGTRWLFGGSLKLGDTVEGAVSTLLSDFGDDQSLKNGFWLNVTYGNANGSVSSLKDKTFMVSLSFSETPSDAFNSSGGDKSDSSDDSGGGHKGGGK